MTRRKKNNIIIGCLLGIVLLMAVGYAAFSTALNISGTGSISTSWDIRITNIEVSNIVGDASDGEGTTYQDLTATINSNLLSPGDSITYDVTVRNDGSLDAVLTNINLSESPNPAISFSTSNLEAGAELGVGEETILKVTITYNDVTEQPENTSASLNVTLTYEQKGSEVVVPGENTVTSDDLKALAVTEGDGLYVDEYEDGRYIYKGTNPNNYITFSGETWRIISVENDGTIKIMRNESIGTRQWDSSNNNNWARPATLNTYLNGEYSENLLDSDKIVSHNFNIGAVTGNNNDLYSHILQEKDLVWYGQIGLITSSEYIRANTNTEQCGTVILNNTNKALCITTNWMQRVIPSGSYLWTITAVINNINYVFSVNGNGDNAGFVYSSNNDVNLENRNVVPVVYLTSDITLSGTGTSGDPYIIN